MPRTEDIQIRDPFVVTFPDEGHYYLYGTTDPNCWEPPAIGFDCYRSRDLADWEGPLPAFRPPEGFWADRNYWAPEMHVYEGAYYLFATFKAAGACRGTQILRAERPEGPFAVHSPEPVTPRHWECLDGTLFVEDGVPWLVFCHEWLQVHDGGMWACQLSPDLRHAAGRPRFLFNASEAAWSRPMQPNAPFLCYVTDGPFLHRTAGGRLLMLWSSMGEQGYTMGVARSESDRIEGPWQQTETPLWSRDGGHGMVFRTLAGGLMLTFHTPNRRSEERAVFIPIREQGDGLALLA
jgi:beta-xylosidase